MKRLLLVGCLMLLSISVSWVVAGCAKIHAVCPTDSVEHVMIGGNNAGTIAIAAFMAMGGPAALAAPKAAAVAPAPAGPGTTVDYNYFPIFGMDYIECGQGPLPK